MPLFTHLSCTGLQHSSLWCRAHFLCTASIHAGALCSGAQCSWGGELGLHAEQLFCMFGGTRKNVISNVEIIVMIVQSAGVDWTLCYTREMFPGMRLIGCGPGTLWSSLEASRMGQTSLRWASLRGNRIRGSLDTCHLGSFSSCPHPRHHHYTHTLGLK